MANYSGVIKIDTTWTLLKGYASTKNLAIQYDSSVSSYEIFCVDGHIAYVTNIFRSTVPDPVRYNQSTNDADKADFEASYKDIVTNRVTTPSATYDGYAITTANPTLIAASDGSNIRTLKSDSSGRLITVGLGTAGTPAGGVISIQGVASGTPIPISGTVTATNASTSATGAAPPAQATYIGGSVTTAAPTYTTGQMNALSLTTAGALRIDGSAVTQPVSGTVTANAGTGNFTVVQTTAANLRAQTGSEATTATATGTVASLTGGAVTTAAPTYTTGQMNPLSLTTAGALRIDGSATTQPVSGTVTAAQATAANLNATVVQATAANLRSQTASEATTAAATGTVASLTGGAVTTAAPTYTTGQMNPLSLTTAGALRIDGSAVTQPISGTVTVGNLLVVTGNATDNTSNVITKLPVIAAVATTAAPTYTTGNMAPLSVDTAGALRVTGTVTANAGTGNFTVVQGTATNLNAQVHQGTTSIGNAWFQKITDGTNTAAVKAASTAAIATDPALVVAISPNNSLAISQVDISVTGNLTALNSTVTITSSGKYSIGGQILGTWAGTITPEGTVDGVTWFTVRTANKSTNDIISTYTANDAFEFYSVAGCTALRLRMSAYTSGTANIALAGTNLATDALLNYSGTDNDGAPPLRHLSMASMTTDGTLHALRNTAANPVGDEIGLITREAAALNDYYASFQPDPSNYLIEERGTDLSLDFSGRLETHSVVGSDEGSFRDDFVGSALTIALSGTPSWTNGSLTVTGTGFQAGVKQGDYIKKTADANTLYVRVSSVDSDTSLTLETAYAGTTAAAASVKSNWIPTIGASGAIAVGTSNLTITTGATSGVINSIIRRGDYGPFTVRMQTTVSQRVANQDIRVGLSDTVASLTVGIAAFVQFTGTVNTTVNFVTSSSTAASDTQTTAVTIPNAGTTATAHEYKIDVSQSQCTLSIDGIVVARNTLHIPGPYDNLALIALAANTAAASNTTLTVDYAYFANVDRIQTDNDFTGEPSAFQGATAVAQTLTTNPVTIGGTDPTGLVRALKTAPDGTLAITSVDGFKDTYAATITGLVPASTATDIFTIYGSATKTIRVVRMTITATQATSGQVNILLIKRSAANTTGTFSTVTGVPHDSDSVAATGVVRAYTANPSALGAAVGTIRTRKVFIGQTTANSDEFTMEFGTRNSEAIVLRGVAQGVAVSLNSVTVGTGSFNISVEWTEE